MRLIVVGAGKVGAYLARELVATGHAVALIEEDPERAHLVAADVRAVVFEGDGTDIDVLRSADVDRADWLLAVTGRDEDNIVACQLATTLGAQHVLARLNDPRNRPTFDALAVPVVGVTDLMARVIGREMEVADLGPVTIPGGGEISLVEVDIPRAVRTRKVADLGLPRPAVVVAVVRNGRPFVPEPGTEIRPRDRVLAVTPLENEAALRAALVPPDLPA